MENMDKMQFGRVSYMERGILTQAQKLIIGVAGVGHGVGATTVASSMALMIGERYGHTAYIEGSAFGGRRHSGGGFGGDAPWPPKAAAKAYYQLNLDQVFRRKTFVDLPAIIRRGGAAGGRVNLWKNVNWVVEGPMDEKYGDFNDEGTKGNNLVCEPTPPDYSQISGRYLIVDSPQSFDGLHALICVVDPMAGKLKANAGAVARIHQYTEGVGKGTHAVWVINKASECVNVGAVERFLEARAKFHFSLFDEKFVYKADLNGMHPYLLSRAKYVKDGDETAMKFFCDEMESLVQYMAKTLAF